MIVTISSSIPEIFIGAKNIDAGIKFKGVIVYRVDQIQYEEIRVIAITVEKIPIMKRRKLEGIFSRKRIEKLTKSKVESQAPK
jgi:cobyrinic acid a,c-diamide synthase